MAQQIKIGDMVIYQEQPHVVNSIKTGDIAGPHFRLTNIETGNGVDLVSASLVRKA